MAKTVRRYLSALDSSKPGRSLKRTAESLTSRMLKIDELIVSADPLTRLHLTQERIELHAEHVRLTTTAEAKLSELEDEFVKVARSYGDRHGITYAAWRQVGVEADVLDKAGIHRTRAPRPGEVRRSESGPAATASASAPPAATKRRVGDARPAPAGAESAPPTEMAFDMEEAESAPPGANGVASHDSPPMIRKRLSEPRSTD